MYSECYIESVPCESSALALNIEKKLVPNCFCNSEKKAIAGSNNSKTNGKKIILIDIDNTLNDWDGQYYYCNKLLYNKDFKELGPNERKHFNIQSNYPKQIDNRESKVSHLYGFWQTMNVLPYAVKAVNEMLADGHLVFFVTKPDQNCYGRSCYEKVLWIEQHFGTAMKDKIIPVFDKSLIYGDYLIDDNPDCINPTNAIKPAWEHIIFCRPYNINLKNKRLCSWEQWRTIFN